MAMKYLIFAFATAAILAGAPIALIAARLWNVMESIR